LEAGEINELPKLLQAYRAVQAGQDKQGTVCDGVEAGTNKEAAMSVKGYSGMMG
jgi:hypothetical protein